MHSAQVILFTFLMVCSIIMTVYGLRIVIRHLLRNYRESQIGPLRWYQIIPESRNAVDASRSADSQVSAIRAFVTSLQSKWPHVTRGVASIIWKKEADGQLRLYMGLDESHGNMGSSSIITLARGLNCRAEEMSAPPVIPTEGLVIAHREMPSPSDIKAAPVNLGMVATQLAESKHLSGSVIFTVEDMAPSESSRLQSWVSQSRRASAGDTNQFSTMGDLSNIMSASGMRASIGAVSNDGHSANSNALLNIAAGSISTLAIRTVNQEVHRYWNRRFVTIGIMFLVVGLALGFLSGMPIALIAAIAIGPAAIVISAIMNLPFLTTKWVEDRLRKGEIAVPAFAWFNPRWFISSHYKAWRLGEGFLSNGPAAPSAKQVIPMYGASITEVLSMPSIAGVVDIAEEQVPQIGVSAPFDSKGKDVVFLGTSGTGQVIGIPLQDINFPIFIAGAPSSGKSNELQVAFASMSRCSMGNDMGLSITPIWGESAKGEGAYDAYRSVQDVPGTVFIDSHNPLSGYRLALEGRRLSEGATPEEIVDNAKTLTSALRFSYGTEIGSSSAEALDYSIRIAMLLSAEEIRFLEIDRFVNPEKPNIIEAAYFIIGGDPLLQPGAKLNELRTQLDPHADSRQFYLYESIGTMSPYLDAKNRDAAARKAPPLNKLSSLRNLRTFWTPDPSRVDVYPGQLPGHFAPVILNMGPFWKPEESSYGGVDKSLGRTVLLCTNYLLWEHIQRYNSGWAAQNKRTVLFLDEVSDIAVDTDDEKVPNVLQSVSKQGRSYGFAIWSATQFPRQLPFQAANEVLAYRSKLWFQLPAVEDARIAVNNMGAQSPFTKENIQFLQQGVAVVGSLKYLDNVIPPFTLHAPELARWEYCLSSTTSNVEAIAKYMDEIYPSLAVSSASI